VWTNQKLRATVVAEITGHPDPSDDAEVVEEISHLKRS
jgi:hypothetical protein